MGWYFLLQCFYFALPAFVANMTPVLVKGIIKEFNHPIDCGKKLLGKPVLGKGKTWKGLASGVLLAAIVGFIQYKLYSIGFFQELSFFDYSKGFLWLHTSILLGKGALFGDIVESFFKRRLGFKPGEPFYLFDQIDYILGALILASIVYTPAMDVIITLLIIGPALHILSNHFAYYTGIRKEKW